MKFDEAKEWVGQLNDTVDQGHNNLVSLPMYLFMIGLEFAGGLITVVCVGLVVWSFYDWNWSLALRVGFATALAEMVIAARFLFRWWSRQVEIYHETQLNLFDALQSYLLEAQNPEPDSPTIVTHVTQPGPYEQAWLYHLPATVHTQRRIGAHLRDAGALPGAHVSYPELAPFFNNDEKKAQAFVKACCAPAAKLMRKGRGNWHELTEAGYQFFCVDLLTYPTPPSEMVIDQVDTGRDTDTDTE